MLIHWRNNRRHHSKVCFSRFRKYVAKNPCEKLKRWRSLQRAMMIIMKHGYDIGFRVRDAFWKRRTVKNNVQQCLRRAGNKNN